ncbi:glycosyltransferase [Paracoccus sp. S-4012]|uniref:glycosyltransferase n=1 Tax=Paracoccus sp. S-4012 TaxID=2665648 RepID=UPI0012AF06DB|nr:glycosyltransferase [Paracoccus sp. S-4012]MRX52187.1 glycosyltransferase [Paracoccus sp. S-4012]
MRVLNDFLRLRRRYLDRHVAYRFSDMPLGSGDDCVGFIEECVFRRGVLRLRGWTLSHRFTVQMDDARYSVPRRVHRGDVVLSLGSRIIATNNQHARVGFDVTLPWRGGPARLIAEDLSGSGPWPLPLPTPRMIRSRRRRSQLAFLWDSVIAAPAALRYVLGGRNPDGVERLRTLMGLAGEASTSLVLDCRHLYTATAPARELPAMTIIMPVHDAFCLMTEAVERVECHTDVEWHLVLIDDASRDARVRPWLTEWAGQRPGRVTLLINDENLGFVRSVNLGLAAAEDRDGPVVLLNSDAFVPPGWASRLLAPLVARDEVASVTPMSNDATIMSVPWLAGRVTLAAGVGYSIDAAARDLSCNAHAVLPTGVGYCMAMSRKALQLAPRFDSVFGRGYGEEVDWCRKTAAAGMVHLGIGNLFVEHRGGQSFGNQAKATALEASARIISARYPDFDEAVRDFIAADPLLTARLTLALARAAAEDAEPLHVYLGHSLGGGADIWLSSRIEERAEQGKRTVVLRVGGQQRFRIELHGDGGILAGETDDIALVINMIRRMPRRRIVYSCGVGDDRPWELPGLLLDLAGGEGSALTVLFHDYFPVSPSLNLLNADGGFAGIPPVDSSDPAHRIADGSREVLLSEWRSFWGRAIRAADELTVFSRSSAEIVATVWPEAKDRIVCHPHRVAANLPQLPSGHSGGPGVIGVLGAIGGPKGAQVVSDLACYLDRLPDGPQLVVIGKFDHRYPLPRSVKVTGQYDLSDLASTLARHSVTAWLMPSVWPETFSFSTHEMLATGLPVMAFDLGAQGEAVKAAPNGHIVANDPAAIYEYYRRLKRVN